VVCLTLIDNNLISEENVTRSPTVAEKADHSAFIYRTESRIMQ